MERPCGTRAGQTGSIGLWAAAARVSAGPAGPSRVYFGTVGQAGAARWISQSSSSQLILKYELAST